MGSADKPTMTRVLVRLGSWTYFVASIAIIFGLAGVLGEPILEGPFVGEEAGHHLAYAEWLDENFPSLPKWYPQEGGGVSLVSGTPVLAHLLVGLTHRFTGLSLAQSYRLVTFLSFPAVAIAIYFLGWVISRRRTVGLLAAIFYLLAPVSWTYVYQGGILSLAVGLPFFPLALVFFDRFLTHQIARSRSGSRRLWLVGLVILVVGGSLADLHIGAAIALVIGLYSLLTSLLARPTKGEARFSRAIWLAIAPGLLSLLVLAFFLVPFARYNNVASREGIVTSALDAVNAPSVAQFLGLSRLDAEHSLLRIQFPLAISLLFLVGLPLARAMSRRTFILGIVAVLGMAVVLFPPVQSLLLRLSPAFVSLFGAATWIVVLTILLPVGAGYAAWAIAWCFSHPASLLPKARSARQGDLAHRLRYPGPIPSALALVIGVLAAFGLGALLSKELTRLPFGPLPSGIDLGKAWVHRPDQPGEGIFVRLPWLKWLGTEIAGSSPLEEESRRLGSLLPQARDLRIDASPHLASLEHNAIAQLDASQTSIPNARISLIQPGWAYQKNVFYSQDLGVDEYGNPTSLNNLAQWFGTEYVFLQPESDRVETYRDAGWELVHEETGLQLWRFSGTAEMATLTSRPAILVTENPGRETYMTVFRLANEGLFNYKDAIIAEGDKRLDQYTLEELQSFEAVLLIGYDYHNSRRAWETLKAYVEQGGSLFVDTGWQYAVAEWEFDLAPEILPVQKLTWTDYGMGSDYSLDSPEIAGDVEDAQFKPLDWEGEAWKVSGADASDVRDWGRVVLSFHGRPLIVSGEYGKGRVIWSGMNLLGHAQYLGVNQGELELFQNLVEWLLRGKLGAELESPVVVRDRPDRIAFSLSPKPGERSWLYWREAYYPDWHAFLNEGGSQRELPVYRGGPGFMLMPVEASSENVTVDLVWETPLAERGALVVTLLGLGLLGALVLDGLVLAGSGFTWTKIAIALRLPSPFLGEGANKEWAERKRAEIEAGKSELNGQAVTREEAVMVSGEAPKAPGSIRFNGDDAETTEIEVPSGTLRTGEEEKLLRAWLSDTDHQESYWSERILSKRRQ